jgi:hypothetical protein
MGRQNRRNKKQQESLERFRERNKAIIQNIDSVLLRYHSQLEEVQDLIKFNESTAAFETISTLPLHISNPIEDSIRYRYIICVELYKVVSTAVRDIYFHGSYSKMNDGLFHNKQIKNYIQSSLDKRNSLAHIFVTSYLDMHELDFDAMKVNLNGLKAALEVCVAFVRSQHLNAQ